MHLLHYPALVTSGDDLLDGYTSTQLRYQLLCSCSLCILQVTKALHTPAPATALPNYNFKAPDPTETL